MEDTQPIDLNALADHYERVYVTSDHHFGHRNISHLTGRGYTCTEEMNADLIYRWNQTVTPRSLVLHLGDFSLTTRNAEIHRPELNGDIWLISGNHDQCWEHQRDPRKQQRDLTRYEALFERVYPSGRARATYDGHDILLSHLPYHGDSRRDDRYAHLRPVDDGTPIICGHVHNTWARQYGTDGRIHRGQVNVAVEVWDLRPVPLTTILHLSEVNR